jgi:HTH-type transcriptional regulator/antitoxin MqsA
MATDLTCAVCGDGRLHLEQSEKEVEIDGVTHKIPFRTHWCEACGSKQGLNEDLRFNARAMRQIRKKHSGLLTGEEVRASRKCLHLSQEQAAQLFGGGPVAFSKYENDEITQSDAMDRLIWLVARFPSLMIPLANRLKMALPGPAKVVVEKIRTRSGEEYFLGAALRFELTKEALKGFGRFTMASNDWIYHPDKDARPAERMVA